MYQNEGALVGHWWLSFFKKKLFIYSNLLYMLAECNSFHITYKEHNFWSHWFYIKYFHTICVFVHVLSASWKFNNWFSQAGINQLLLNMSSFIFHSQVGLENQKLCRVSWHLWIVPVMSHWHVLWRKKKRMWHTPGVLWGKRAVSFESSRPLRTKSWCTRA